ncbi:MAG: putative lipid II flippase FtsW [Gammaproteobacteria bacterium 28-57-27]|nr:MAG: putative lipid II flippase FtsW [Gammaproteobacteria bacterium 28-57-27]
MIEQARNFGYRLGVQKLGEAVDAVKARGVGAESVLRLDGVLLFAALGLLSLGLVMVSSASIALADKLGSPFHYALRQGIFALAGLGIAAVVLWRADLQWIERQRYLWLLLALLVLLLVLLPGVGHVVNGARRWVGVGPINVQASEPARLFLVLYLASYLVAKRDVVMHSFKGFVMPMLALGFASLLLLAEPDLGATVVLMTTGMTMLFLAGGRLRWMVLFILLGVAALYFLIILEPYRVRRLIGFSDPWADPLNSGFQLSMALIAIGRGGWDGVGLGESVQKLFYLPEAHTDFLFSVLSEELGLPGILSLIMLYGLFLWRGFAIARLAEQRGMLFGAYMSYGLSTWVGLQAFINMGVNMGLLPTKGLTLPFMSYGGSSLIIMCVATALMLRVYHEATAVEDGEQKAAPPSARTQEEAV